MEQTTTAFIHETGVSWICTHAEHGYKGIKHFWKRVNRLKRYICRYKQTRHVATDSLLPGEMTHRFISTPKKRAYLVLKSTFQIPSKHPLNTGT